MFRNLAQLCSSPVARTRCLIKPQFFISNQPVRFKTIYTQNVIKIGGGPISIQIREIHVSTPKKALHPILVLILRPIAKFGAIVFGRTLRKRWQKLTPEQREAVLKKIKSNQTYIVMAATVFFGFTFLYYIEHMQEVPVTKRKRFIIFNDNQMKIIAQLEYHNQMQQYKSDIVPTHHPIYRRVGRVANRILALNSDIPQIRNQNWEITVIDRPEITNAFALPEGKIFVFSGMLNLCTNDDQLAIVLSHEISHAVCNHVAEQMSRLIFFEIFGLPLTVTVWSILPDLLAILTEFASNALANVMFHLPYSRKLEAEADVVGLQLAARACFDVREAPVFWAKMKVVNESLPAEFLSTHPSHETRQTELRKLVPIALRIRDASNCPLLGPQSKSSIFFTHMV